MEGVVKILDMLGRTIAQMEQQLEQQRQVIETLSATKPADPIGAKQPIKEPESPSSP